MMANNSPFPRPLRLLNIPTTIIIPRVASHRIASLHESPYLGCIKGTVMGEVRHPLASTAYATASEQGRLRIQRTTRTVRRRLNLSVLLSFRATIISPPI